MRGQVQILGTPADLSRAAAQAIVALLNGAIKAKGMATIALSGGTTPRAVYELLSSKDFRLLVNWPNVHFFWGDERSVPPYMPDSNYRMAKEALLDRIAIPSANVHRIIAERPPYEAAQAYAKEIKDFFHLYPGQMPTFDLFLLGLGEDGHTASIFPGSRIDNKTTIVADVFVEKLMTYRITLTFPVINTARTVMFLVSGKNKADILQEVIEGEHVRYPAQMVNPSSGKLQWLVDRAAASQLRQVNYS